MKHVINNINLHKSKSIEPLKNQQITYIPTVANDQIECTVQSYLIDGKRILINQATQACFKLKYLKFKPMHPRKAIKYKNGNWNMEYLIYDDVIYPFMFFINGFFIPWEIISISVGQENYYVTVNGDYNPLFLDYIRDIQYAQIINLPDHISYRNYYDGIEGTDDSFLFSFNEFGQFDTDRIVYTISNNTDAHHIIFNRWNTTLGVNAFPISTNTSIKLTSDNVILFINNRLATGIKENIKRAHEVSEFNEDTGRTSYYLEFTTSDEEIEPNPNIKFDSTLLTIGDGTNENNDIYDFIVFANTKYTKNADNISRASLIYLSPLIQKQNAGEETPEYLQDLQKPFIMAMDRNKKYDTNVAEAIKTMMSYNTSLFNPVFLEKSNLVIEEHDGSWAIDILRDDGTIAISRQHNSMISEFVIMLVNGVLYKYYKLAKYKANQYIVPIQDIEPDDTIELLRFQNVNNNVMDIIINEDDEFVNYSPYIINDNMVLYSTETDLDYFDFPSDGLQHFPVEYTLESNDDGIKITLSNEFYYGKPLKVAYRNRFQHFCFNLTETTDKLNIDLGDKFMYCNDYSKYLIFYNGRRLGSDHYRLTLPVRPTTPFNKFDIYLAFPVSTGDRLDVIYVPSLMQDIIMIPEVEVSGDIVVDKKLVNYGLSTELYMVWLNGKKIPKSHISDIDSIHMRITSDESTTKTLCITKYIPDIDILSEAFQENEALWDSIIAQLSKEEIYALLGINGEELTNTEEDVYAGAVNIRAIMFELIRDQFIANPRVDITGPFIYDYQDVDKTAIEGYDSAGNAILPVMDANRQDNLDNVLRPWP